MVDEGGEEGENMAKPQIPSVYYGVCIPEDLILENESPIKTVFTDKIEAFKVLKEFKGSRFKVFSSEEEAANFSTSTQPLQETQVSTPVPSEGSTYGSLKPQQLVKFRRAIEAGNIDFVKECISENPRYLMTPSDTPSILQEGSRYNALHVVAKSGKQELYKIIIDIVKESLTTAMYPEADPEQNQVRQQRLLDLYLNMPDKGSGDTPLHLASKFGHPDLVELLTSEPSIDTKRLNKFGESACDIICTRAKVKNKVDEERIRDALEGMHYIPVYREIDGIPHLGKPLPQSECNPRQLFRGSASPPISEDAPDSIAASPRLSGGSLSSPKINSTSFTSPRTPRTNGGMNRTFTLSGSSPGSPMSLMKVQGNTSSITSPLAVRSPGQIDLSADVMKSSRYISALIGPLSERKAASTYKELKSSNKIRERLQDPAKGLERQCDSLAKRIEADFTEYWQFLDEFLDLTSDKGLQRLEDHLNSLQHELARIEESARCQEFDDDDPANNSVFGDELGEMEFFVSKKDVDTPLKAYKGVSDKNNDTEEIRATTVDNGNTTTDENDAVDSLSTPLSPVTFLASALDSLDICSNQEPVVNHNIALSLEAARGRRPSVHTKEMVQQFGFQFCQSLTENLPQTESDTNIQEWGLTLLNYWECLRRQVNMMRSDPQGRWSALDSGALVRRVIECVQRELEDSVDISDYIKIQAFLDRVASFKVTSASPEREAESILDFRIQRQNSERDIRKLKEIQPLARLLVFYMENRSFPEKDNLEEIWDLKSTVRISTNEVNKARKFLHSKVFSDSDSNSTCSTSGPISTEDLSWVHQPMSSSRIEPGNMIQPAGDNTWRSTLRRADSGSSLYSQSSQASSQYCTPPSSPVGPLSPAVSQASSMLTAEEGQITWMEGDQPTQTDRQVVAALKQVKQEVLQKYPNLWGYLIMAGNFEMNEMKRWPTKLTAKPTTLKNVESRKLDFDLSTLNI